MDEKVATDTKTDEPLTELEQQDFERLLGPAFEHISRALRQRMLAHPRFGRGVFSGTARQNAPSTPRSQTFVARGTDGNGEEHQVILRPNNPGDTEALTQEAAAFFVNVSKRILNYDFELGTTSQDINIVDNGDGSFEITITFETEHGGRAGPQKTFVYEVELEQAHAVSFVPAGNIMTGIGTGFGPEAPFVLDQPGFEVEDFLGQGSNSFTVTNGQSSELLISDDDGNFDIDPPFSTLPAQDAGAPQVLASDITIDGKTYVAGEAVNSTGPITLVDEATGREYIAVGISIGEPEIGFDLLGDSNIVGHAFVGDLPPPGVALSFQDRFVELDSNPISYDALADSYPEPVTFEVGGTTYTASSGAFSDTELAQLAGVDWDEAFRTDIFSDPTGDNGILGNLGLFHWLGGDAALTNKVLDITFSDGSNSFRLRDVIEGTAPQTFADAAETGRFVQTLLATLDPDRFTAPTEPAGEVTPVEPSYLSSATIDGIEVVLSGTAGNQQDALEAIAPAIARALWDAEFGDTPRVHNRYQAPRFGAELDGHNDFVVNATENQDGTYTFTLSYRVSYGPAGTVEGSTSTNVNLFLDDVSGSGRRLTVDGDVDGDDVFELHADARAESIYSLASGLLTVTEGGLPSNWGTEDYVAYVFGAAGIGGLTETSEWSGSSSLDDDIATFAEQLVGLDSTSDTSTLDYSMFDTYFEEPNHTALAVLVDEALGLQGVAEHLKTDLQSGGGFELNYEVFEQAYLASAQPTATAIGRRSLEAAALAGATYTLTYGTSIYGSAGAAGGGATAAGGGAAALGAGAAATVAVAAVAAVAVVAIGYFAWRAYKNSNPDTVIEPDTADGIPQPGTNGASLIEIQLTEAVQSQLLAGDVAGATDLLYEAEANGVAPENLVNVIQSLPEHLRVQVTGEIFDRVQTATGNIADYFSILKRGRAYSALEDFVYTDDSSLRGAMEGFGYLPPAADSPTTPLAFPAGGVAERLAELPEQSRATLLGLWIDSISGADTTGYQFAYGGTGSRSDRVAFFRETMSILKTQDPGSFDATMSQLFNQSPKQFQFIAEQLWLSNLPVDQSLISGMLDALTTSEQAKLMERLTGLTDRADLYDELVSGETQFGTPSIGAAMLGLIDQNTQLLNYLNSETTGTTAAASAFVEDDVYVNLPVTEEVELAPGVFIAAPTVDRAGVDAIVVYTESSDPDDGVEAGYYTVGLVEEDGIVEYRLINESGAVITDYTVHPPADDLATGIWEISHINEGRTLLGGFARLRRLAFATRPLRLLGGGNGATTGRYVGNQPGNLAGLWNERFVTERPITTTIANEAFNNQQPVPTLAALGPDAENVETVEALAFLLGIAPSEITPEVTEALTPLAEDGDALAEEFDAFLNSDSFDGDLVFFGTPGEENIGKLGVFGHLERSLLKNSHVSNGLITQDEHDTFVEQAHDVKRLFDLGDHAGAFTLFAKLIVQGNKLNLAAEYMKQNPTATAEDALEAVEPIFAPYEALTDDELVAVSLYAGLDQGGYSGVNVGANGYFFTALNNTLNTGSVDERVGLGAFNAVLHRAMVKIAGFTDEVLPPLNELTGGAYGDPNSEEDPNIGPVHEIARGLTVSDPQTVEYYSNLAVGEVWNDDHRFHSSTGGPNLVLNWRDANVVLKIRSDKASLVSPITMSGQNLREVVLSPGYTLVVAEEPTYTEDGKLVIVLTTAPQAVGTASLPDPKPLAGDPIDVDQGYAYASVLSVLNNILDDPNVPYAFKTLVRNLNRSNIKNIVNFLMIYKEDPSVAGHLDTWANSAQGQQVLGFILDNADDLELNNDQINFVVELLGVPPATRPPATPEPEAPSNLAGDTPEEWLINFVQGNTPFFQPLNAYLPSNSTGGQDTPAFVNVGLMLNNLVGAANIDMDFHMVLVGWLQGFAPQEQQQLLHAAQNNFDPGNNATPEVLQFLQNAFNHVPNNGGGGGGMLPPPQLGSGPI